MVDTIIFIDAFIGYQIYVLWCWSAFFVKLFNIERLTRIASELRPFVLPSIVLHIVSHIFQGLYLESFGWMRAILDLMMFLVWHFYKDVGDDDRWKKRMKKVAGKVKALASGRLVVVPNHA